MVSRSPCQMPVEGAKIKSVCAPISFFSHSVRPSSDTYLCKYTLHEQEVLQSWKLFPTTTLRGLTESPTHSVSPLPFFLSFLPSVCPSLPSFHKMSRELGFWLLASPDLALYIWSQRDNRTGSSRQKDGFLLTTAYSIPGRVGSEQDVSATPWA